MRDKRFPILLVLLVLVLASMACGQTDATPVLTPEWDLPPEKDIDPTATSTEVVPPNRGQIAYSYNGDLWLYIVDSAQTIQVTQDGIPDNQQSSYYKPQLSPNGRYLAFLKNTISYIIDLENNQITSLQPVGMFIHWTGTGNQFYLYQGDMQCPEIENLSVQEFINFDLYRLDLDNFSNPLFLANISGGLSFPQKLTPDGQWVSVLRCGCYSECGATNLINIPSNTIVPPPFQFYNANLSFSPDSNFLAVSEYQIYGYSHSPLYVANSDYSGITPIFSEPNTAPDHTLWSPTGEWIASTVLSFDAEGYDLTESRVIIMHPDGSNQVVVEGNFAELLDWSPDGTQLLYLNGASSAKTIYIYDLATGTKTPLPFSIEHNYFAHIDWGRLP